MSVKPLNGHYRNVPCLCLCFTASAWVTELRLRAGTEGRAGVGAHKEPVTFALGFLAVCGGIIKNTLLNYSLVRTRGSVV